MTKLNYKKRLFDIYSKSLALNSNLSQVFLCPLCHRIFPWESHKLLTIEHVIPEALGGSLKTLTCKKCNNDYGSKLISKLKFNFDIEDKVANKKPLDAKMTIDGKSVSVDFTIGEKHEIATQVHRSNPKNVEHISNRFSNSDSLPTFNLKFVVGYKKETEQLAILLICYLMLFRQFGYFYALNSWGLATRNVIVEQNQESDLLRMSLTADALVNESKSSISICRSPTEFKDFTIVQIQLESDTFAKTYIKVLPSFPSAQFNPEFHLRSQEIEIQASLIPDSNKLPEDIDLGLQPKARIVVGTRGKNKER